MLVVSNEWTAVPLTSPEEISKGFVNKSLWSSRSSAKQSHINTTCRGDGPQENAGVSFNPHPSSLVQSPNSPFFPSHVGAEPGRAKKMIFSPFLGGKNRGVPSMRMQVILDSSFRPSGFSPYMGREERRAKGLDYSPPLPLPMVAHGLHSC